LQFKSNYCPSLGVSIRRRRPVAAIRTGYFLKQLNVIRKVIMREEDVSFVVDRQNEINIQRGENNIVV